MKSLKGSQAVLYNLLCTINGLESEECDIANYVRSNLIEVVKDIAYTFAEDKDLHSFDRVFTKAGWDDQGIRYCRNDEESKRGRLVMGPQIVRFTSDTKESWEVL